MRLREMLDELKDTPTNKHEQYDQVSSIRTRQVHYI